MADFTSVPVLDWNLIANGKRTQFLKELQHALINVGFFYLDHPPVDPDLTKKLVEYAPRLFQLPQQEKDACGMVNSEHFLGYTRLGREITRGEKDWREQWDFGSEWKCRYKPGDGEWLRLWGEAQWPADTSLPGFRSTLLAYMTQLEKLSYDFTRLIAEALGLGPNALDAFLDPEMQHRSKVVKYPSVDPQFGNQGVGPHFDSGFLTFLLQASPHRGLQVQNVSGAWIDVPPIDGTVVVNLGKGLETVTKRVALATSHRVLSPDDPNLGPRYSIPFFQNITQNSRLGDVDLQFSEEVLALRQARLAQEGKSDSVNYDTYNESVSGLVALIGRIKSHPDVAERHYPTLFKELFPNGPPQLAA